MCLSYFQTAMCPLTFQILPPLIGLSFAQNEITVPPTSAQRYKNTGQQVHTYVHTDIHAYIFPKSNISVIQDIMKQVTIRQHIAQTNNYQTAHSTNTR
jgi:propanediol utilization protein